MPQYKIHRFISVRRKHATILDLNCMLCEHLSTQIFLCFSPQMSINLIWRERHAIKGMYGLMAHPEQAAFSCIHQSLLV